MSYSVNIRGDHMRYTNTESYIHKRKSWIREGSDLLPLLTVWGTQGLLHAGVDVAEEWYNLEQFKLVLLLLAVIISIGLIVRSLVNENRRGRQERGSREEYNFNTAVGTVSLLLIPGVMLIGAVLLLEGVGAVGTMFAPIFRASLMAIVYVLFGVWLGKPLIYLGLWLFALTAVMAVGYLGFSGVVLDGMGGMSLLVCGWMLRVWSR
jgi:hypothetical protein